MDNEDHFIIPQVQHPALVICNCNLRQPGRISTYLFEGNIYLKINFRELKADIQTE